jgi:DNA processing protein
VAWPIPQSRGEINILALFFINGWYFPGTNLLIIKFQMENAEELLYKVALSLAPGIGGKTGRALLAACGTPEAIFKEKQRALIRIEGVGRQILVNLKKHETMVKAEKEIEFMERFKINARFITDKSYPPRLKNCIDAPLMLFLKGDEKYLSYHTLAIVGTRKPSEYGKSRAESIVRGFAGRDISIVSGLAYGIDTVAHHSALDNRLPTVAVLAHGLDIIYPGLNRPLAGRIADQGCLVTEFPSKTKLNKDLFPRRNRIIAGLAEAVVVIESGKKGGGLITADIALSYNRDVFAVPGCIGDPGSAGPHFLIKTNRAALAESSEDISYYMGWDEKEKSIAVQKKIFSNLDENEILIFRFIENKQNASMDEIYQVTSLPPSKVNAILLKLEFDGLVKMMPGNRYAVI